MTSDDFWRRVGAHLRRLREHKHWKWYDVQKHGGPNYHTVDINERGAPGTVTKLQQHARALQVSLIDVFRAVLDESSKPLSPEAQFLLRKYERTTVEGRQALLALAQALPDSGGEPSGPRRSPNAHDRSARHKR